MAITIPWGTGCGRRIDGEHCVFTGGDRGCDGQACVVVIGGGVVEGASHGCLAVDEALELEPDRHVHLRDGVPRAWVAEGEPLLESDTVQGVLARRAREDGLEEVCSVDEELPVEILEMMEVEVVFAARGRLEGLRATKRIREEQAFVDEEEAEALRGFYDAVDQWALTCSGLLDGTSGSETGTESSSSTSADTSSSGEAPCTSSEDCPDSAMPFCSPFSGECVSCGELPDPNSACAHLDPATPVCLRDECVECTPSHSVACTGSTPVCDPLTNTCVPCTEHSQCGEAACDMFTGWCLPEDAVVRVGPGQRFATIGSAVASFGPGEGGTIIIHQGDYLESVMIDNEKRLAFLAAPGDSPNWSTSEQFQLEIWADGTVFLDGLRLSDNSSSAALYMTGGQAWLDRTSLVNNIHGAYIVGGAELMIRNCFVGSFFGGVNRSALRVYSTSSATIVSSTLIGDGPAGTSLYCDNPFSVTARNSIMVSANVTNYCPIVDVSNSVTSVDVPDTGNLQVGALSTAWFTNIASGNFHLSPSGQSAFAYIAQWQLGDPTTDIDGDPRPTTHGTPDFPGADVP
ncbi:hypothetical protein [Paraliomyxa miuraensis]|uniref:hypothetical protein n=1 Tax=Paraliomyxa miuraensis TaxID=376150 RepID=UPI0022518BFF|nr:hypothetical protein [Paraliomyxa miuraensis]